MTDLSPFAAEILDHPVHRLAPGLEMLTSPESIASTPGAPVSAAPTPPYRKKLLADEDASTAHWRAVLDRDRSADGSFVFAVTTTGIYCRPSCPARRPRRENVKFFADGDEARTAGFRACKRCRPDEEPAIDRAVAGARQLLDAANGETITLADLGAAVKLSASHLQREFQRRIGLSPKQYALAQRAERLKREMSLRRTVLEAGFEAGYGSASRVYDEAARKLGMSPGRFRSGGRGVRIAFSTQVTPLGRLLLAVTDRGLCAVRLGDDDDAVRQELAAEFFDATLLEDDSALAPFFEKVVALLAGSSGITPLEIPLDIQATAFQALVWQALQRIPRGTTVSYGELARQLGRPKAVRAMARACATNPVALVVPCHRVVGKDGALTGYRWGVKRKQALLALEAGTAKGAAKARRRPVPR